MRSAPTTAPADPMTRSASRPRVLSVVGTRPEAIKMMPVVQALNRREGLEHRVALTGQHEMAGGILDAFGLERHYDLDVMTPGQALGDVGRRCLDRVGGVMADFAPHVAIVQGDTATVFFAGLAAFFERVRLAHVEAGLRSRRKWSPFPEEMLRRMTDDLSDFCFAPTAEAAENLAREGVAEERVFVTGNTVVDALQAMRARPRPVRNPRVAELLERMGAGRRLVLLTAHRRESFGPRLESVFRAVAELARRRTDTDVLYPVHPNPNVARPARRILAACPGVHLTEPLAYGDLVQALDRADLVVTDSGGIQEEACALGVHALVLRDVTERPEGVRAGVATLVGTDPDAILAEAGRQLARGRAAGSLPANPYGDGRAGERIADVLAAALLETPRRTSDWTGP